MLARVTTFAIRGIGLAARHRRGRRPPGLPAFTDRRAGRPRRARGARAGPRGDAQRGVRVPRAAGDRQPRARLRAQDRRRASTSRSPAGSWPPPARRRPMRWLGRPSSASCRSAASCGPRAERWPSRRARPRAGLERIVVAPEQCGRGGSGRGAGRVAGRRPAGRRGDPARARSAEPPGDPGGDRTPRRGRSTRPTFATSAATPGPIRALVDRGGGRPQPPDVGPARHRQDDAGTPAAVDPAAAEPRTKRIEVTRIHSVAGVHPGGGLVDCAAVPRAAPHDLGGRARRRRRRTRRRARRPRPPRRPVPRRAVGVRPQRAGGAAPAAGGRPGGRRARPAGRGVPDALRPGGGDQPVPVRARRVPRAAAAPRPTTPATGAGSAGPLLDRIDLLVDVQRPSAAELRRPRLTSSDAARGEVEAARERQRSSLRGAVASRATPS